MDDITSLSLSTSRPGCDQSYPIMLDVCHNIYQKFLTILKERCSNLDISYYINEAIEILSVEVQKLEKDGEIIYPLLFRILSTPFLIELEKIGKTPSWRSLIKNIQHVKIITLMPYRIFFFFFRMVSLILFTLKVELSREIKQDIAKELLTIIVERSNFLKHGSRVCPLKEIFAHCRKNALHRDDVCQCTVSKGTATLAIEALQNKKQGKTVMPANPIAKNLANTVTLEDVPAGSNVFRASNSKVFPLSNSQMFPTNSDKSQILVQAIGETSFHESGFNGDLSQISIWQVLQVLGIEKSTGCLKIKNNDSQARIYFDSGMVVHCEYKNLKGEEAFLELANYQEGQFSFISQLKPTQTTMEHTIENLLLQIAAKLD